MCSTPIHEIAEGHNDRIKQFYSKLWCRDDEVLPKINLKQKFAGSNITINASTVETFCSVVDNQGESFKTVRNSSMKAPMDFAIVLSWHWQVSNISLSPHPHFIKSSFLHRQSYSQFSLWLSMATYSSLSTFPMVLAWLKAPNPSGSAMSAMPRHISHP